MGTEGRLGRLEVLGAAADLPAVTADDFGRVGSAEHLRTPEAWQEWLGLPSGRDVWLVGEGGFASKMAETNYMARAEPGTRANGYVKVSEVIDGLAVWQKRGEQDG